MLALLFGLIIGMSVTLIIYALRLKSVREQLHNRSGLDPGFSWAPPFKASAYLERIEQAYLSIQETSQPVDGTITLWIGLDGLRIDSDGTSEWIRRGGPAPQCCTAGGSGGVVGRGFMRTSALSGLFPPYWLPPMPLSGPSVLYADNMAIEIAAPIDPTMAMQAQLDKLRVENRIMSMQQQLQQTCVTPPLYPGCIQHPKKKRN